MGKHNVEVTVNNMTVRRFPEFRYTLQNVLISLSAMVMATASFFFTAFVLLPLSFIRIFVPKEQLQLPGEAQLISKTVLIVGVTQDIGRHLLRQYSCEKDTVIIAAGESIENVRKVVIDLGDVPAIIQSAQLDISSARSHIADTIKHLDKTYGPISHLYALSSLGPKEGSWNLSNTAALIDANIVGTVACVLTMYDLMKERRLGKIAILSSIAGIANPANMISYAATKAFINSFATSLRVLAAPCGVDVITVQPGLSDEKHLSSTSKVSSFMMASPEILAIRMKEAVECGGVGVLSWPVRQSAIVYGLRAFNPICEELGKWVSMKLGIAGTKIN